MDLEFSKREVVKSVKSRSADTVRVSLLPLMKNRCTITKQERIHSLSPLVQSKSTVVNKLLQNSRVQMIILCS